MATDRVISIRLTSDQLDRLQRLADKAGVTRHKLITNLITGGLENLEDLDKIGLLRALILLRNGEDFLKSLMKQKTKELEAPELAAGAEILA
jgi:predicted DNA-binding protein